MKGNTWLAYIDFKENEISGLNGLLNFANSNNESPETIFLVARMFTWEHYNDIALKILDNALPKFLENPDLLVLKSECLKSEGNRVKALDVLSRDKLHETPAIAVALAEIHEEEGEIDLAIECVHQLNEIPRYLIAYITLSP